MKKIAVTTEKSVIVEISNEELETLDELMNAVSVYARACMEHDIPGYSGVDYERYYNRRIYPLSSEFWKQIYDLRKDIYHAK